MKITIEKTRLIAVAPFLVVAIILASCFVWQLKTNITLRQELSAKKNEFKEAEAASKHLMTLEKQASDMKQKQEALYKKVPVNEKEPFGLMKALIRLGGQAGLRKITLSLKEKAVVTAQEAASQAGQAADQGAETPADEAGGQQGAVSAQTDDAGVVALPQGASTPIYLQMDFEGSFPQILVFLEKLMSLERIVEVEGIFIERKKETLPYQKASLDLIAYTF